MFSFIFVDVKLNADKNWGKERKVHSLDNNNNNNKVQAEFGDVIIMSVC